MRLNTSFIHRVVSSFTIIVVISMSFLLFGCGGVETPVAEVPTGSVILSWQAPNYNEDGSQLTDLAGYRVYYGESSQTYTEVVSIESSTSCSISGLPLGRSIYFSVTAFDTLGNESILSSEVSTIL